MATDTPEQQMESGGESEPESESGAEPLPESLVAGRAKRATAGNRLSTLLDQEADDELELLFAEDEEDVEFEAAEGEDDADVQLDSSDDDEADQGPPGERDEEDLEGEKELQRQTRAERLAQKRKAQDAVFKPQAFRKRVKIDPTTPSANPTTPVPKSKKKLDRVSWIPSSADGPLRSSTRKATVQNKQVVQARIREHEKRRMQQIAVMEAAAKRKETSRTKVMTQEDRLAEAAKTERLNSKSLNRWEATEKRRAEEEKARLVALRNRKLEGPVITWWSGVAEWLGGKLKHVGRRLKVEEHDKVQAGHGTNQSHVNSVGGAGVEARSSSQLDTQPGRAQDSNLARSDERPDDALHPNTLAASSYVDNAVSPDATNPNTSRASSGEERPRPLTYFPVMNEGAPPPTASELGSEYSARNMVILDNLDPPSIKDKDGQRRILFKSRTSKVHSELVPLLTAAPLSLQL